MSEIEIFRHPDADRSDTDGRRAKLRGIIEHGFESDSGVGDGPSERSDMIQAESQWLDSRAIHQAISWLQARHAAERSGDANGAPGIASRGPKHHIGSHGRARTAARSSGDASRIAGVSNGAVVRIVGRDPV